MFQGEFGVSCFITLINPCDAHASLRKIHVVAHACNHNSAAGGQLRLHDELLEEDSCPKY